MYTSCSGLHIVLKTMTSTSADTAAPSSNTDPSAPTTPPSDAMPALLNLEEVQLIMKELAESDTGPSFPEQNRCATDNQSSPSNAHSSPGHIHSSLELLHSSSDHSDSHSGPIISSPGHTQSSPDYAHSSPSRGHSSPGRTKSPVLDENNNSGDKEEDGQEKVDLRQLQVEMDKAKSGAKPGLSYIALISLAVTSTPDQRMVLGDIYSWVSRNFPYFRLQDRSWRNSIRHNLSLNECFIKAGRSENGKGNYWAVHPANVDDFRRGDFRRRRARRQVRKCNARLEEQNGRPEGVRPGTSSRSQRPSHPDAASYVVMTSSTVTDAELIAMFGPIVLKTTRDPSTPMDTCPAEGAPSPASPVTRDAVTSHQFNFHPTETAQNPQITGDCHSYQPQHTYPSDHCMAATQMGFSSDQSQSSYSHYDTFYSQGAPPSSCRWQHQQPVEGSGYTYQGYESQHSMVLL